MTPEELKIATQKARSAAYAQERMKAYFEWQNKQDRNVKKEITSILNHTKREVEKEASRWITNFANAEKITYSGAQLLVSNLDMEELEEKARKYVRQANSGNHSAAFTKKANREMRQYNFTMKMSRGELLQRNIDLTVLEMGGEVDSTIRRHLRFMGDKELDRQAGLLGFNRSTLDEMKMATKTVVDEQFHGVHFSDRIWNNQEAMKQVLHEGITKTLIEGKNPKEWMSSLSRFVNPAFGAANHAMGRIAVTEAGRVQVSMQKKSYEKGGYTEYQIKAEPSACPFCAEENGKIYKVSEMVIGENAPMYHPHCRCSTAAHMSQLELESILTNLKTN